MILSQNDALMGRSREIIQLLKKDDDVQANQLIEPQNVKTIERMELDLNILNACWIPASQIEMNEFSQFWEMEHPYASLLGYDEN